MISTQAQPGEAVPLPGRLAWVAEGGQGRADRHKADPESVFAEHGFYPPYLVDSHPPELCIIILIRQNLPKPEQHPVICPFLLKAAGYGIIATTTKLRSHAIFDRLKNVLLISFALIAVVTFVVQIWTTSAIVSNHMERAQNERGAPDLPQIEADPAQLPNIFVNLMDNAADAMLEGGALTIQADLSPDRRSAVVQVKDTGIGIAPEDLTRIFDEFCRSKAAKAHSQMGTGLGLSLVKRIVETYDGRIDVQSAVGEGSAFTVTLPMDVSAQPSAPPASEE